MSKETEQDHNYGLESIFNHYDQLLERYGPSPQALDWRNQEQMDLRFEVLCQIGDLQECSVADVGSGLGDLYDFLRKRGWRGEYTGFEMVPRSIAIAKERYPETEFVEGEFLSLDITRTFDWIFLSGTLHVRFDGIEPFTYEMIKKMYGISRRGVAFNLMTSYVDFQKETLQYHHPEKIFGFCKSLTQSVTLRHDYPLWEFTIYLLH